MTEEKDYKPLHQFFIAGVQHHQINSVLNDLQEGMALDLVPEPDNKYDPCAIKIEYKEVMIGYVPKKISASVCASLQLEKKLSCVIVILNKYAKPWEQCKVEIREEV